MIKENGFRPEDYQDNPQHTNETSSVGALWPPEDAYAERVKGFYTGGILTQPEDLAMLVSELVTQAENSKRPDGKDRTRISLRAVVDGELLRTHKDLIRPFTEAIIGLDGTQPALKDTAIGCFGLNHDSRLPNKAEYQHSRETLEGLNTERKRPAEVIQRAVDAGYELAILPNLTSLEDREVAERLVDQMEALYSRFGWDRKAVTEILSNEANIICVAVKDEEIVSAGIAELAAIPIGENTLRMCEITEAATKDGHGKNGIYNAVSTRLLMEVTERSVQGNILGGELDLAYGECNAAAPGVLRVARSQGRVFAVDTGVSFGIPESGVLYQHVEIKGGNPITTPYNDLYPASLTRQFLYNEYRMEDIYA